MNKIDRKHVDFVICDPATMQPLVALELDDKSHQRQDRQERDTFVDQVFHAAGLPLIHVPAKRAYRTDELVAVLAPYLDSAASNPSVPETALAPAEPVRISAVDGAPCCPKCNAEMVLRTTKSGPNAGRRFWGCSNFPTCRSMLPYQE